MNQRIIDRFFSLIFIFIVAHFFSLNVKAQTNYGTQLMNTVIEGTSNVHDWESIR